MQRRYLIGGILGVCWPVTSAKEISSLSLYVCVISLSKNVSMTLKHWGRVEGPCMHRIVHCIRKKGSPMALNLEKLFSHCQLLLY